MIKNSSIFSSFSGTFSFNTTFPQAPKSTFLVIFQGHPGIAGYGVGSQSLPVRIPAKWIKKRPWTHVTCAFFVLRPLDVDLVECHAPGEVIVWETQGSKIQRESEG